MNDYIMHIEQHFNPIDIEKVARSGPFEERKKIMEDFSHKVRDLHSKRNALWMRNKQWIINFKNWIIQNILAPLNDQWYLRQTQKEAEEVFLEKVRLFDDYEQIETSNKPTRTHLFDDAVTGYVEKLKEKKIRLTKHNENTCIVEREKKRQWQEITRIDKKSENIKKNNIPCDLMNNQKVLEKEKIKIDGQSYSFNNKEDKERFDSTLNSFQVNLENWKPYHENSSCEFICGIGKNIIRDGYIKRERVLDISLSRIKNEPTYKDCMQMIQDAGQEERHKQEEENEKLPYLPKNISFLNRIEQLNIEGHAIANLKLDNMTSLHTLRASNSGIVDFLLTTMPLLTVVDISDNANLDTINIRKVHTPNLKHLIIDADKVHLLKKCDLPEGCTLHVKNMNPETSLEALKDNLKNKCVRREEDERFNSLINRLAEVKPGNARMEIDGEYMVFKTEGSVLSNEIKRIKVPVLSFCETLEKWRAEECERNPANFYNINEAAYTMRNKYAEFLVNKATGINLVDRWLTRLPVECLEQMPELEVQVRNNALDEYPESLKQRLKD